MGQKFLCGHLVIIRKVSLGMKNGHIIILHNILIKRIIGLQLHQKRALNILHHQNIIQSIQNFHSVTRINYQK